MYMHVMTLERAFEIGAHARLRVAALPARTLVAGDARALVLPECDPGFEAWASFDGPPPARLVREVAFSPDAISAVGEALSRCEGMQRWIAPRRLAFVRLDGGVAHSPLGGEQPLGDELAAVFEACDGSTPGCELEARLPRIDVAAALRELVSRHLVGWTLRIAPTRDTERALRERIARVGDAAVRDDALARLDALEAGRAAVAAARDEASLSAALDVVSGTYARITGVLPYGPLVICPPRETPGVSLPRRVIDDIAPALSLVLASARYAAAEAAEAFETGFRTLHRTMFGARRRVPFVEAWFASERLLYGVKNGVLRDVARRVRERWTAISAEHSGETRVTSGKLATAVEAAFAAPSSAWAGARRHTCDVALAAHSRDAIDEGRYLAVLEAVHVATDMLPSSDAPDPFVIETGFAACAAPPERVLRIAELWLEQRERGFVVVSQDGRFERPLLDVMGPRIAAIIEDAVSLTSGADHEPRWTIDRLVVRRESWRIAPEEATRARGLPRFVVVKGSDGRSTILDLESARAAPILDELARTAKSPLRFTELLPTPDDAWHAERLSTLRLIARARR
jgi:hypothetical protein